MLPMRQHMAHRNRSLQDFALLDDITSDTVTRYGRDLRRTYVNAAMARMMGQAEHELVGATPSDTRPTQAAQTYEVFLRQVFKEGRERNCIYRWTDKWGRLRTSHIQVIPEADEQGQVVSLLAIGRDATHWHAAMRHLELARHAAAICTWEVDFCEQPPTVDVQGGGIFGLRVAAPGWPDFIGHVPSCQRRACYRKVLRAAAKRQASVEFEHVVTHADGSRHETYSWVQIEYDQHGGIGQLLGVTQDVSAHKRLLRQTHELENYDSLTRLPNRAFLYRWLTATTERAQEEDSVGLIIIDLDHFQRINDSLGHRRGDQLLSEVANRLKTSLHDRGLVARLGADEFAVVISDMRSPADLQAVSEGIKTALSEPFFLDKTPVMVNFSAGVSLYPSDGQLVEELVTHADAALNHAKSLGRNNIQFYARRLTEKAQERLQVATDLRQGVGRDEFVLFYQPKVRLEDGAIIGTEALMRWRHPSKGLMAPDRFIGVAEETGLIIPMGAAALRMACANAVRWNRLRHDTPLKVAVNLSPRQFQGENLVGTVKALLAESGCQPQWIELEITEGLLLDDSPLILAQLNELHDLGVTIAIDDFGTGYSALSYLTRFPIDTLKVDRSFVRDLGHKAQSAVLAKAIVALGQSLQMEVVAEGVETATQRDHLLAFSCKLAQGYMYGKPMPEDEFTALLARHAQPSLQKEHPHEEDIAG